MFRLSYNYAHFTCLQGQAQNSSSQASAMCEPRTSDELGEFQKGRGTRDQIANFVGSQRKQGNSRKNLRNFYCSIFNFFCFIDYTNTFDCESQQIVKNSQKEMSVPDHLTCHLRNLYVGQEATVKTIRGTTDWFKIGKGV